MQEKDLLPSHYTPVEMPNYEGDGVHSVEKLQEICKQFKEYCHQQQLIKQDLKDRLISIKGLTIRTGNPTLDFVAKIANVE